MELSRQTMWVIMRCWYVWGIFLAGLCAIMACGGGSSAPPQDDSGLPGVQSLSVSPVSAGTIASQEYFSTTSLKINWTAVEGNPDHWEILAEGSTGDKVVQTMSSPAIKEYVLTGLRAGSSYTISIAACDADSTCETAEQTASGQTADEVWQIQGTGNTVEGAAKAVEDGNTLPYVFRYGDDADPALAGRLRLYYAPQPANPKPPPGEFPNMHIGLSDQVGSDSELPTYTIAEGYGLNRPDPPADKFDRILAFQGVPMIPGNRVRLFFEASKGEGQDSVVRLYTLDSQDGLIGLDFDAGESTLPHSAEDYNAGGGAEPTVIIGVAGDAEKGDSGLTQARQSKIGWPLLDYWAWDGSAGTFMVITGADACGHTENGLFYATYDGTDWAVTKDESGCARPLVDYGHGPVVVHLGGNRYKLYYEDELSAGNHTGKPLRMIYADGGNTGDANAVEFDDWEPQEQAREVHFIWPDGSEVDKETESGLGDHVIFMPTQSLSRQLMHMNLSGFDNANDPRASAGMGIALLINP